MNDERNFKLEKLNFRIDYSGSLPYLEIENDTSMLHVRAPIQEVEKLYNFIENFLTIYSQAEKNQEKDKVIILPYSDEK
jgi:hypothetical protein